MIFKTQRFIVKDGHSNISGFTLIELLVVLAIISILSSVIFTLVDKPRAKARDAQRLQEFRQIQIAFQLYYDDFGKYPCGAMWLDGTEYGSSNFQITGTWNVGYSVSLFNKSIANPWGPNFLPLFLGNIQSGILLGGSNTLMGYYSSPTPLSSIGCDVDQDGIVPNYISQIEDPQEPKTFVSAGSFPWHTYGYAVTANRQSYILTVNLEDKVDLMQTDGGFCDDLYEIGPGTGVIRPPNFNSPSGCTAPL